MRLLNYLRVDPENLNLLSDAAISAFDTQQFALCDDLLDRHAAITRLTPTLVNLRGLSAMSQHRFEEALDSFASLRDGQDDPAIAYNMAYANAMLGRFERTTALVDDRVIAAIPAAAAVKLKALHHLGHVDEALDLAKRYADQPHADPELQGAYATLLFDQDNKEDAKRYAELAADTADGLTVRALFAISDGAESEALSMLERTLQMRPGSGRAKLGLGLCLLSGERFADAAQALDEAANLLHTHAGSWVSAGWAHLLNGDLATARARFEQSAQIDRGFAEAPGGLAVICFHEKRFDEARRYTDIALRLDRSCLSAALALNMLTVRDGNQDKADSIMNEALNRSLNTDGRTIAQVLARRASRRRLEN
ncbi:tetratricopeptide repeat protein [Paraburkholderia terrae]|uniref:tetratricopeptide repeat protein n=1 Tax=Paraburkholderia terrae TaxID=311230 RepID=UPI0033654F81